MRAPDPIAPSLRSLFLHIARATIASGCVAGCASERDYISEDAGHTLPLGDDAAQAQPHDAGLSDATTSDARPPGQDAAEPTDAGAPDARPPEQDAAEPTDAGSPQPDGSGDWLRVECERGSAVPAPPLRSETPIDAISIQSDHEYAYIEPVMLPDGGSVVARGVSEVARSGLLCAGASNVAECERQVTALQHAQTCVEFDCRFAIVRTGDALRRIDSSVDLVALFGSIDSAAEAVLLAAFDGQQVCPGMQSDPRDIGMEVRLENGGAYALRVTWEACGEGLFRDDLTVLNSGVLVPVSHVLLAPSMCAIGRRPAGLCNVSEGRSATRASAFLAQCAALEAASVHAFFQWVHELSAHGAPEELRLEALEAMLDEVRHARDVSALARAYGADHAIPEVQETKSRSLFELSLDNVHEGCVRETFGALVATYQAETAQDPMVRDVMRTIAEDETRHAALSWKLMAWLMPQLSEPQQAEVHAERRRAYARLADDLDVQLSEDEHRALGFPTPDVSRSLLEKLGNALALG